MFQSINEVLRRWALLLGAVFVICVCSQSSGQEQIPAPAEPSRLTQSEQADQRCRYCEDRELSPGKTRRRS